VTRQVNNWKYTISLENDGYAEEIEKGARYVARLNRDEADPRRVVDMLLKDAVSRHLKFAPVKNADYLTVGVWDTTGARPLLLAAASARFDHGYGRYFFAGTDQEVDPMMLLGERETSEYEAWEKS
jgi:hypothetical protein